MPDDHPTIKIIDLGPQYAYVQKQEDSTWCAVIVGHTARHLPASGIAEVLDMNILPDKETAMEWIGEMIGPSKQLHILH